jgi:very-short-patch-repair endonuclease
VTPSGGYGRLRRHQLGVQFRRQHPIGPYIVDFCCIERKLIIELDGGQHEDLRTQDEARTQWLSGQDFRVLRFSDREALMETEADLADIQNRL